MAHVDFDGSFSQIEDPFLSKLLEQQGMAYFANKFKQTRLVCVQCLARLHRPEEKGKRKPYFTLDADGYIKLESAWINARKKTTSLKLRSKRLDRILKHYEAQAKRHAAEGQCPFAK